MTTTKDTGRAFVLGGNSTTLAYLSSTQVDRGQIAAHLLPLAWTPIGVVVGMPEQRVFIAADNIGGWVDQTFPPDDERAFVASLRDLEMLVRVGWQAESPDPLTEDSIVNPEDVAEDVLEGLAHEPQTLGPCAVCRRTCVIDDFVWNDRQLCAWDYHTIVFGKRGPWRDTPYEDHHFETLPHPAYVARPLVDDAEIAVAFDVRDLDETLMRELVNRVIERSPGTSFLAVKVESGYTLLREGARPAA